MSLNDKAICLENFFSEDKWLLEIGHLKISEQ